MIKIITKKALYIGLLIQCFSVQGMFTALRNRQLTTAARPRYNRVGYTRLNQRNYWQPVQAKRKPLIEETNYPNKNFLTQGQATVYSTYLLPNVLSYNISKHELDPSDSMAQFAKALFQISPDGHISIVKDKNKISYLLTPEFFGVLRGAREKGLLDDPSTVKKIVTFGQSEYAKMMSNNENFPEAEIKDFIAVMNEVNKTDANIAQALEDAYLFLRINPSNNHDIIHYLLGFNRYGEILSEERLKEFETISAQQDQVVHLSDADYNQNDRENFIDALSKIPRPSDRIKFAHDNFALAVSAMVQDKRNKKLYSPQVKMDEVSYGNYPAFSTCAEAGLRDLIGNMVLDEELQIFTPSIFFPGLKINDDVMKFFNTYNTVDTINDKDASKDFVKLVSGVDGVTYVNKNKYEISSIATEQNLIVLCNKFFSLHAKSLSDLGKMLSNERRTLTFELMGRDSNKTIAITIHDKKTDKTKYMYLNFAPGHTKFKVGKGNKDNSLLDPKILLADFNNPKSRSLLFLHEQPEIAQLFFRKMKNSGNVFDPALYHVFSKETEGEKSQLIRTILLYSDDQKALNLAYSLYDSLSDKYKNSLKDVVPSTDVFKQKLSVYQTLKE